MMIMLGGFVPSFLLPQAGSESYIKFRKGEIVFFQNLLFYRLQKFNLPDIMKINQRNFGKYIQIWW